MKIKTTGTRHAVLSPVEANQPIRAALSSDAPVKVFGYTEVLKHTAEAVDLSRVLLTGRQRPG